LTGNFVNFVENPVAWLSGRGVDTVTFVGGDDDSDDEGGATPILPVDPFAGRDEKQPLGRWTLPPTKLKSSTTASVQRVAAGAVLPASGGYFDWLFAPYAHRPSNARFHAFKAELTRNFGSAHLSKVINAARSGAGRDRLRLCYDQVWRDHNLVSMALYAGPINKPTWPSRVTRNSGPYFRSFETRVGELGWLSTGDFQLKSQRRRSAFLRYYSPFLERVDALVLPHHGAHGNFDSSALAGMSNLSLGLASAGSDGRYGHPSLDVEEAVQRHGASFHHVSDEMDTLLRIDAE